jgi:hypothetical protein
MGISLVNVDSILDFGGKLIDKIWPDKTAQESERAKAQLALIQLQQSGDLEELKTRLSAIISEAQSSDPWTSRARPSYLYVMYTMILGSIPIGILSVFNPGAAAQIAIGMKAWLGAIPQDMWWMFGAGYLGYTHYRTKEKEIGVTK